jgi:hypothetical protein
LAMHALERKRGVINIHCHEIVSTLKGCGGVWLVMIRI